MPPRVQVSFDPLILRRLPQRARPGALPASSSLRTLLACAARRTLARHRIARGEVSVALLGDRAMARLHRHYLGKREPTDVLAFGLHEPGDPPLGDVYIGFEQARRQAERLRVPLREELTRLAIHGTLHVLGYDHPSGSRRTRSGMWRMQERILREVMRT